LDNKVFDIIDARCNHEVHWESKYFCVLNCLITTTIHFCCTYQQTNWVCSHILTNNLSIIKLSVAQNGEFLCKFLNNRTLRYLITSVENYRLSDYVIWLLCYYIVDKH